MDKDFDLIKKNQINRMIEFENRKIIKARQRKQKQDQQDQQDMYSLFEGTVDSCVNPFVTKRGTEFSIDEEIDQHRPANPLNFTQPNLELIQFYQNPQTGQKIDLTQNETCQQVQEGKIEHVEDEEEINNQQEVPFENEIGKIIQIDEINYLQSFSQENNSLKYNNHKKSSKIQKDFHDNLYRIQKKQIQK